ncbi:hypothetical protein SAMN05216276_108913 [Streptosporangium subroseum]|uniref:Uncharacterized protein n=1 Tax=Streptosporangium subroseum TaxID=106412 RepID=A0A239P6E7_9ACTN|nr:hypothetical protein SAMN05216276_108913 [Streptosporangium subroseum]
MADTRLHLRKQSTAIHRRPAPSVVVVTQLVTQGHIF